jgi:hypothetical protein
MRRRKFIRLVGGAVTVLRAQRKTMPVIGFLHGLFLW